MEQLNQLIAGSGVTVSDVSREEQRDLLASFRAPDDWYDMFSIDRLSAHEADIITARLIKRLAARTLVTAAQEASLRLQMVRFVMENFIHGDPHDLDRQLLATAQAAKLNKQAARALREVVALGIYPLPNEQ